MISEQKTNGYIKEENMTDRGGGGRAGAVAAKAWD